MAPMEAMATPRARPCAAPTVSRLPDVMEHIPMKTNKAMPDISARHGWITFVNFSSMSISPIDCGVISGDFSEAVSAKKISMEC